MAEREWREATDMRTSPIGIAIVMATAAALRFWAIGSGLPDQIQPDEAALLERAVAIMKSGDFNPHAFDQPTLYLYLQTLIASVRFIAGILQGAWQSLADVSPAAFSFSARFVTAALGTLTVFIVYAIGMRWGARHALLGAGLLAVMAPHADASHYVDPLTLMVLMTSVTLLLSLRAHEKATAAAFGWAGAAAGLAAATLYSGSIAIVLPLIAAWMTLGASPSRLRCALAAAAAAVVAFFAAAPYTVLDLPGFLDGVALAASTTAAVSRDANAPMTFLRYVQAALGWPAMILAVSGLILGIVRAMKGPGRVRWTLLVSFPVVYGYVVGRRAAADTDVLLAVLPFACVLAAIAVVSGVSLLRRFQIPRAPRTALIVGLTVAALLPPAIQAVSVNRNIVRRARSQPVAVPSPATKSAPSPYQPGK